jgi:hypothetical protein
MVRLGGTAFDVINGVAVDLFTAGGKLPTFFLNPGNPGLTATQISVFLPSRGLPNSPPTGPRSFVVSNAGAGRAFAKKSNAVSVPSARASTCCPLRSRRISLRNGKGYGLLNADGDQLFQPAGREGG